MKDLLIINAPPAQTMSGASIRRNLNDFVAVVLIHPDCDLRSLAAALVAQAETQENQ